MSRKSLTMVCLPIILSSQFSPFPDDLRMAFIVASGVQKLIERFEDSDQDVQFKALDCVKVLSAHGMAFRSVIT